MPKSIITIGYEIPAFSDRYHRYSADQSLLDADIVLFTPDIMDGFYAAGQHQGLPLFDDNQSFRVKDASRRWRDEILTAVNSGKTVFVTLEAYLPVVVQSGRKEFSGTGRNRRQTNYVESFDNFQCLPVALPSVTAKSGAGIAFSGNPIFAQFWNEFRDILNYSCYFNDKLPGETVFCTKVGNRPISSIIKSSGGGHLVLLPRIPYDSEKYQTTKKSGESLWNKDGIAFGNRLVSALLGIEQALREEAGATPPPDWVAAPEYVLDRETELQTTISSLETEIDTAAKRRDEARTALADEMLLKALLYEKGKRLEAAIIEALRILGYKADSHDDGTLQLDQVILAPEGTRYIGEAEGKDNCAINIDKFRQLSTNIQEDFERAGVSQPAHGILFGNAERLKLPAERGAFFTEKCVANAKRTSTVLIRTPDLFKVAKYVRDSNDREFALICRTAIADGGSTVKFPKLPPPTIKPENK